ncbi:MAG: hypothetical protein ACSLE0_04275 [Chitinophagaceae bacterium]
MKKNHSLPIDDKDKNLPSSVEYKPEDDIYNKGKKEPNINPDDNSIILDSKETGESPDETDLTEIHAGSDLDVPGAELDDKNEEIGEEDEENNYYSLGGDNHEDLEESKD